MRQLPLTAVSPSRTILTVAELNQRIRGALERDLSDVWVTGEISTFRLAPSGHCYFNLKDEESQVAAVLFRSAAQGLPFRPADGMAVIVRGRISLYEVRGALQLYVDKMEPCGLGSLQLAVEQLKQRLAAEGLLDPARKRPLPYFPKTVGVVTALRGAAIHDILVTLRRRSPATRVLVRPALVQGRDAPDDIVAAIHDLAESGDIDVAIVGRGGGSLEDLWAFNDERVARAIAAAPFPIVSAVGHEIDFTVADLVADVRAPTPTAAAALVVPDQRELLQELDQLTGRLHGGVLRHLQRQHSRVAELQRRLRDPRATLKIVQQRVDELHERATRAIALQLERRRALISRYAESLHALSPLAVLQRGYAIARAESDGRVITRARDTRVGDRLRLTFLEGAVMARIEDIEDAKEPKS